MLRSVSRVGRDFKWDLGAGHCGKGQPAKVDAGGPWVACEVILGGRRCPRRARNEDGRGHRSIRDAEQRARLLERCRKLVERAIRGGAHEAEVFGTHSRSVSVRFEKGDLKLTQVDDGSALGLRCFRDARLGFSSTNQSDDRSLARTAQDALTLCGFAPPDAFNRLPAARPIVRRASLVEPALANCGVDEAVELGREFLARIQRIDKRLSVDNAACDIARVTHAIHASTGTSAVESDAQISLNVFGMAIDGDDVGGFHYTGDNLRRLADVESATERLIEEFARVALGNLGARAAESYAGPVLFAPDALLDLFVAPIVSAASAIAVQRGRSPLAERSAPKSRPRISTSMTIRPIARSPEQVISIAKDSRPIASRSSSAAS